MKLFNMIKKFRGDEDGAVTVDWVVLTAAVVGLGIVVMNVVGPAVKGTASNIKTGLTSAGTTATSSLSLSN